MGDDHGATRELQQGVLEGAQGFDIQIVGRFIQQQHVAAGLQQLGQMQTTALTTGEFANPLLLVGTLEVEAANIGAARELVVADAQDILTVSDLFEYRLLVIHAVAELIDRGQYHGFTQGDGTGIRLLLTRHHAEQGRLTGTVRADDADDGTLRNGEGEIVDQHPITVGFAQVGHFHHLVAEARSRRNEQLVGLVALLVVVGVELFEASHTGLGLGLTPFRVLTNPLQLFLDGLATGSFGTGFLRQTGVLLLQPGGVVAFPRDTFAAVQLQDPARHVVEEVTVVGDGHYSAFVVVQEALQPGYGFRIQVVGRFVQQQHVRLFQQQTAQCHTAALTTGEVLDLGIPCRQAQGIGRTLQLVFHVVAALGLDDGFQLALFAGQLVKVGIRVGVGRIDLVQTGHGAFHLANGLFDRFAYGLLRLQLRLLGQVADLDAGLRTGFPFDLGVDARHDAQQGRFTGAVQTQHADLGAREEAQGDVLENMTLGRHYLADPVHGVNKLSHWLILFLFSRLMSWH